MAIEEHQNGEVGMQGSLGRWDEGDSKGMIEWMMAVEKMGWQIQSLRKRDETGTR
jgi:hypothetical protein